MIISIFDIDLKDDSSDKGGKAFASETLRHFIEEQNLKGESLTEVNKALKECGIEPITLDDIKFCGTPRFNQLDIKTKIFKRDNISEEANEYPWRCEFYYRGVLFECDDYMEKPDTETVNRTLMFLLNRMTDEEYERIARLADENKDENED